MKESQMAASNDTIVEDLSSLECSICKGTLDDPRTLPCGHSYCGAAKPCPEEDAGLQVMCKLHVEKPVTFWCIICKDKACSECFDTRHQYHTLMTFPNFLHQKLDSLYASTFARVQLMQNDAVLLREKLEATNAANHLKQLVKTCFYDLCTVIDQWRDMGEFQQDPRAPVNLNLVESFLSQSCEELDNIETRLKLIKTETETDVRFGHFNNDAAWESGST